MKSLSKFSKYCDIIIFFVPIFMVPSTFSKQYRSDYEYNRKTDAFYKFHMEEMMSDSASEICEMEGASLMVPKSDEDLSQAHGMYKRYPDIVDLAWIGNDGNEHDSIEVTPLIVYEYKPESPWGRSDGMYRQYDVISRNGEAQHYGFNRRLPFICKVEAKDIYKDEKCKVLSRGYKYFENVGSCYRIPERPFAWNAAYSECRAQGAHLVVLNSELEHQIIYNLTNTAPAVRNAQATYFFYAGIRAEGKSDGSPLVFKTIFNQTLEEAGYSQWSDNEPNNHQGREFCVTIFKNDGKYNDIYCEDVFAFICEKEVHNS